MKIGDFLFFAPGVRFKDVDLNGTDLPHQFERRIAGFYLDPADRCATEGFAFAAAVTLVSCIDALARFRVGGGVGTRFKTFVANELPSFSHGSFATRFGEEFRNGLVHEARIKDGGQFTLDANQTVQPVGSVLLVNPQHLGTEVRSALSRYVALLDTNTAERRRLATNLAADLAVDFLVSKSRPAAGQPNGADAPTILCDRVTEARGSAQRYATFMPLERHILRGQVQPFLDPESLS